MMVRVYPTGEIVETTKRITDPDFFKVIMVIQDEETITIEEEIRETEGAAYELACGIMLYVRLSDGHVEEVGDATWKLHTSNSTMTIMIRGEKKRG